MWAFMGFFRFFSGEMNLVFGHMRVKILTKKVSCIFLARPEIFSRIFCEAPKRFEIIF